VPVEVVVVSKLRALEAFLSQLTGVPRLPAKLSCLMTRWTCQWQLEGVSRDINTLATSLTEVRASVGIVELLRLALHMSNFMNLGSGRVARAIQLKSLERFATMKGGGGGGGGNFTPVTAVSAKAGGAAVIPPYAHKTLLHLLAFVAKNSSTSSGAGSGCAGGGGPVVAALNLSADLPGLQSACLIDLAALDGTLHDLGNALRAAKAEIAKWSEQQQQATPDQNCQTNATIAASAAGKSGSEEELPAGLRDLAAFVARGEEELRGVRASRVAAARQVDSAER
jgi:hypothetical protein